MKIIKRLTISRLQIRHRFEGRYEIALSDPSDLPHAESSLTLTAEDMSAFSLDPSEVLVGAEVELTLKAVPYSPEEHSPHMVILTRLISLGEMRHIHSMKPPEKTMRHNWRLEAKTPIPGGTLVPLPPTYYKLDLLLSQWQYRSVRQLPADSAFEVHLRLLDQRLRDLVLTYRGYLEDSVIFPPGYASRMITLARAMLDYLNGDVDVVGHYCGLETEEECERPGTDDRLGTRTWHREYLAVDSLSPENWETAFADSVAQIDNLLGDRYDHHLPMTDVKYFYDHLETSAWESRQQYPVEELTVGLEARYSFRESIHLPAVIIQARSIFGNRKGCEAACHALSQSTSSLFQVKFDRASWSINEI